MRVYGSASRAGVGYVGIDVPLEPPALSARQVAQRAARQGELLAAGEAAVAAARQAKRSRAGRPRPLVSMSAVAPPPSVPPVAEVVAEIEDLVPDGPVRCEGGCGLLVTVAFIVRTGARIHPPCRARLAEKTTPADAGVPVMAVAS